MYPKSPYITTGGIVYFARLLDKIRLHNAGTLPADYHANLGGGFDKMCVDFLRVSYDDVKAFAGKTTDDEAALRLCFEKGHTPSAEEIKIWNGFMTKRGWRDDAGERLAMRKKESGFENRTDVITFFDYLDADEGRKPGSGY